MAQCNCPYWHGVFGGIYLTDIRATAYSNLIRAENYADAVLSGGVQGYQWQQVDFDGDGEEEVMVEGEDVNLYLSPAEGGTLFEWDLRRHAYNLLSTLSRKPEAYHQELASAVMDGKDTEGKGKVISIHEAIRVKDSDIADWLIYDDLPRSSLVDRFLDGQVTLEDYSRNGFTDAGDFAGRPYEFAVNSIRSWWDEMGQKNYQEATELLITADCGGSNGYRVKLWKVELQKLANELGMIINVCHFPPGTSKWNKIEHKMFCYISKNWRGQPLITKETVVNLIGNTKTTKGLTIKAKLDKNIYEKGQKITDGQLSAIALEQSEFHGEWNYKIKPQNLALM
jgi:hypothetical protein